MRPDAEKRFEWWKRLAQERGMQINLLEQECAEICELLYALGIPSVSEDGYGENVQRLRCLLGKETHKNNPDRVPEI